MTANAKKIGPRFGKDAQKVFGALRKLTAADLVDYREGNSLELTLDGGTKVTLSADEVSVSRAAVKGWSLGDSSKLQVLISTEITTELKYEGLVREAIRTIQDLRKSRNLHVADRIHLTVETTPVLRAAFEANADILKRETLAIDITFADVGPEAVSAKMDDETLKVDLRAASPAAS